MSERRPGINVGDVVRIAKNVEAYQSVHPGFTDETFEVTFRQATAFNNGDTQYVLHLRGRDTGTFVLAKPGHCRISAKNPALVERAA